MLTSVFLRGLHRAEETPPPRPRFLRRPRSRPRRPGDASDRHHVRVGGAPPLVTAAPLAPSHRDLSPCLLVQFLAVFVGIYTIPEHPVLLRVQLLPLPVLVPILLPSHLDVLPLRIVSSHTPRGLTQRCPSRAIIRAIYMFVKVGWEDSLKKGVGHALVLFLLRGNLTYISFLFL